MGKRSSGYDLQSVDDADNHELKKKNETLIIAEQSKPTLPYKGKKKSTANPLFKYGKFKP
ncbi:MAG: hypothetical protein ACOY46_20610 [Bacillota bacterium]